MKVRPSLLSVMRTGCSIYRPEFCLPLHDAPSGIRLSPQLRGSSRPLEKWRKLPAAPNNHEMKRRVKTPGRTPAAVSARAVGASAAGRERKALTGIGIGNFFQGLGRYPDIGFHVRKGLAITQMLIGAVQFQERAFAVK